jgi:hypothetical protein
MDWLIPVFAAAKEAELAMQPAAGVAEAADIKRSRTLLDNLPASMARHVQALQTARSSLFPAMVELRRTLEK